MCARCTFAAGDEFALAISRLATDSDVIAKKAIYEGAKVIADKIKSNLDGVLSPEASGNWNAKIGFDGYGTDGVANQLKARVLESGSSKQQKTPFVRPAVNATKKQAVARMGEVINEEIQRLDL